MRLLRNIKDTILLIYWEWRTGQYAKTVKYRYIISIALCLGIMVSSSHAFKFKLQNNVNQSVRYLLHTDERNISSGEIQANSTKALRGNHEPNMYHIVWYDPDEEWGSKAGFEVPETITPDQTIVVSLEFVPLKITIFKSHSKGSDTPIN